MTVVMATYQTPPQLKAIDVVNEVFVEENINLLSESQKLM
jgi:hypothetical protein